MSKKPYPKKLRLPLCLLVLVSLLLACGKKEDPEALQRAQLIKTHADQCMQNQNLREQAACLAILARRADQADLCEVSKSIYIQETCYAELARRNSNTDLCNKIKQEILKDVCFEDTAQAKLQPTDCQYIKSDAQRDSCYLQLVNNRGELDICAKIKNKDLVNYCNATTKNDFLAFPTPIRHEWNEVESFFDLFFQIEYPDNTSLESFYNSQLKPAISEQIKQPLAIPKLTLLPYYLLTPASKSSFLQLMDLDGFTAENIRRLNSSLSFFDNSLLLMNLPNLLVRSADGQLTKINQNSRQMIKLAVYSAFEAGHGIRIKGLQTPDSLILLPHSLSQLAALVLADKRWITDVNIVGLCNALANTKNSKFYQAIPDVIAQGINIEHLGNLSPDEQNILLQFVGAYLFNLNRRNTLSATERHAVNYDLLSITLLNYYFNSGGRAVINFSGRKSVAQENCNYYAKNPRGTRQERIVLEELLTSHIKQKHPQLFAELEQFFCKPCSNLFVTLSRSLKEKPTFDYDQLISKMNEVFANETEEINTFLQQSLERT